MVDLPRALDHPGLRLTPAELLALRPPIHTARQRPSSRRPGALPSRISGQGIDLREIRAFAEGDDPRRIDAAASARTGHLHVRSFHDDREDSTLLIADFRRPMLWGTGTALRSVRAARHLAVLGWRAVDRDGSVGLLVAGDAAPARLAGGTGQTQMREIARLLADHHDLALMQQDDQRPAPLAPILALALRHSAAGGRVHIATGPEGLAGIGPSLGQLARGRRVEVHLVLDPCETQPPRATLSVSDGSASRVGRIRALDQQPLFEDLRKLGVAPHLVLPDDA
ncbi:DUF58 domain-containing protein [Paracoccus ravus]|uniref:DUF58 domain-containing protein n=1 Tax=Paracoccus ravus TaxID=2447760 RepID=UPI001ADA5D51|nr:DUF58 domain-containing protein [Paracoccus ravus]